MRARSIKPGICANEVLGTADPLYTLLFERLWMMADREGRLEDRPLRIKAQAFPYREGIDCDAMLTWLQNHGFILRYTANGQRYIQILKFTEHQHPHVKEPASKIPPPEEDCPSTGPAPCEHQTDTSAARLTPSSLTPDSGLLTPDSRNAREKAEAVWTQIRAGYPKGIYREADWLPAEREYMRLVDRGELPDKLFEAVTLYRAQQLAKQAIGTQYVLAPSKFFGGNNWRGPFPMPLTKADVRLAGNMTAMQEFIEGTAQ